MATLVPVDHDPFATSAQPNLVPVDHDPFAPATKRVSQPDYDAMGAPTGSSVEVDAPVVAQGPWVKQSDDILKGAAGGVVRGLAGTAGFVTDTAPGWLEKLADTVYGKVAGETDDETDQRFADRRANVMIPSLREKLTPETFQHGIETVTGPAYEPTTRAGKFASAVAEVSTGALMPGAGYAKGGAEVAKNVLRYGVIPGLTSEAAGQVFEGSPYETAARVVGGIAGGGASALTARRSTAGNLVRETIDGASPQHIDAAEALFQRAQDMGTPISRAEAIQAVTNGATKMGDLQHTVEGMGGMKPFYSQRPALNEVAGRRTFDTVSPQPADPSQLGPTVQGVAQQVMRESPEGGILADTLFQAGPRVSPEQAGNVMQQELRNVHDRREGMRAALADQDYAAARAVPTEIDAQGVVNFIDRQLQTAKGETRRTLEAARDNMFRGDGALDTSVEGLHNARVALSDLIDQASRSGATRTAGQMQSTVGHLDEALEAVPAYGQARRNFRAASQPLDAFEQNRAPGAIIERDQFNARNVMPAERAPQTVQKGGPSATRDFNSVATPAAREAFEQHIVTQVLDKATREGADLSADSIRQALRQNEDVLRQYPGVRDRLESVAIARDGLARLENTPIGRLAQRDPTTEKAVSALFPKNPLPGSQNEIADAISVLAERNPGAARQLVRTHAESMFNEATQRLGSVGPNQSGGAKFAAQLLGNSQQRANMEAAVRALPNGDATWQGFNRLLEVLEAQQFRQATGSRTAFKIPGVEDLRSSGLTGKALEAVSTGGIKLPARISQAWDNWRLGKNLDEVARLLTDPGAAADFARIASAPSGSNKATALAGRLTSIGITSREGADRPRVTIQVSR